VAQLELPFDLDHYRSWWLFYDTPFLLSKDPACLAGPRPKDEILGCVEIAVSESRSMDCEGTIYYVICPSTGEQIDFVA